MKRVLGAAVGAVVLISAIHASVAVADPRYGMRVTLRRSPTADPEVSGKEVGYAVQVRPPKNGLEVALERRRHAREEADFLDFAESEDRKRLAKVDSRPPRNAVVAARLGQRVRAACLAVILDQDLSLNW